MNDRCRDVADLLIASTLHELSPGDSERLQRHLAGCARCRERHRAFQEDDRRLSALVAADGASFPELEGRIMERIANGTIRDTSIVRWSGWRRFALAAVVLAMAGVGIRLLADHSPLGGVAWAQVIEKVVDARDYVCRIDRRTTMAPDLQIVQYASAAYGLRQDLYRGETLVAQVFIVPEDRKLVTLVHRDRKSAVIELTDEQLEKSLMGGSPAEFAAFFRAGGFTEIGARELDGRTAEGIEIGGREIWGGTFEEGQLRMWVDPATGWPLRIEFSGKAAGGDTWAETVMDDFQWNQTLPAEIFEFEIPAGYADLGRVARTEVNEESALDGLRNFARLMQGRYPSQLLSAAAFQEFEDEEPRLRREGLIEDGDIPVLLSIQKSCEFLERLRREDRDPAYHGATVRRSDHDRVLLRWRLDDGRYRVVYGDLTTDEVPAAQLAALESP